MSQQKYACIHCLWIELNNTNMQELHDKCDTAFKIFCD